MEKLLNVIFFLIDYRLAFEREIVEDEAHLPKRFSCTFIVRTAKVWKSLPASVFPTTY